MLNEFGINYADVGSFNPAFPVFVGFGYDKHSYISTAKLMPSPYVTQSLIQARIGGLSKLIEAVDDSQPPVGTLNPNNPQNNPAVATLAAVIQNVTTEINGYLSPIYPIPLAQTGTVCILQVATVSTDGLNSIASLNVVEGGNYLTAPNTNQYPAYMRYLDPLAEERLCAQLYGLQSTECFAGTGAQITVAYTPGSVADESGQTITTQSVTIAPTVVNGGKNYQPGELLVLVGGTSVVPAKIREAACVLVCHDLMQRRLAPDEFNTFKVQARKWRGEKDTDGFLTQIGEGNMNLDGTYKRFFSAVMSWNRESVLNGANSR